MFFARRIDVYGVQLKITPTHYLVEPVAMSRNKFFLVLLLMIQIKPSPDLDNKRLYAI